MRFDSAQRNNWVGIRAFCVSVAKILQTKKATLSSGPKLFKVPFRGFRGYTLNLKCMMSPSSTT